MSLGDILSLSLFFFFLAALGLHFHAQALCCACGLSLVVARGLSRPGTCGILVPQPGIELASPALEGGPLTTGLPGTSFSFFLSF